MTRTESIERPAGVVIGIRVRPLLAWGAFAAAIVAHLLLFAVWPKAAPVGVDLNVYRAAGDVVLHGRPLYEGPITYAMEFTYTPFAALLFIPFGLFPIIPLAVVMTLAHLFAVIPAVWLCWRVLGYRRERSLLLVCVLLAAPMLWLEPVWMTVTLGQVNLGLMMLVLADVGRKDGSRWQGVGIGIAAGIKLTPVIFVLYLLATRRFRAAFTAIGTVLATIGLGFLVLPLDSLRYWGGVFIKSNRVGDTASVSNQSISGMLARFTGAREAISLTWLLLALAVGVLGLGMAVWARRRGHELLAVSLVGLTATVVSPFSWEHHWVWVLPLLVFLVHTALTTRGRAIWRATLWVAGVIYVLMFGWIVTFPRPWTWRLPEQGLFKLASWPWLEALTRNTYLIVFVIAAAYSIYLMTRRTKVTFTN